MDGRVQRKIIRTAAKMVSLQMESVRKDVQIAQKDTQIMEIQKNNEFKVMELRKDNECRLLELRQYYERQLSEYKLTIERLLVQANTNLTHIGVNALLAKENIEQNDELRGVLKVAGDRVVPELSERPEKEPYVTTYKRKVNENTRFRITRNQLAEVEACDRMTKRFQEAAEEPDAKKPRSKHYGWLKDSEKFLQIKCPNPVSLWVKIRNTYPHVFYGLKFVTKIKTEIEFLNEDQLRAKYHDNVRMCERNLKRDERKIAEFKRFGLTSADDAVEKCLTPSVCAKDRVSEIINNVIAQIREEFKPPEAARRFENTSEYTVDQVFNGFKMYANVVNFGSIINYYNWTPPPDAPPQQQQQQQSQQSPFPVSSLPSIVASPPVKREPAASAAAADFSSARL